jgi:hypothetical protein
VLAPPSQVEADAPLPSRAVEDSLPSNSTERIARKRPDAVAVPRDALHGGNILFFEHGLGPVR